MESRVEGFEKEMTGVHERLAMMGGRLEGMDQDIRERLSDTQARLEGLENGMEVMKGYL